MGETRHSPAAGTSRRRIIAIIVGLILAALLVMPWPENTPEPIIFGVIPAPLFFWILWTGAFIAYIGWIAFRWDPYARVAERAMSPNADTGTPTPPHADAPARPSDDEQPGAGH